jgi:hypothetical protein
MTVGGEPVDETFPLSQRQDGGDGDAHAIEPAHGSADELWVRPVAVHSMQSPGSIFGSAGLKVLIAVMRTVAVRGVARCWHATGGVVWLQSGVRQAVCACAAMKEIAASAAEIVAGAIRRRDVSKVAFTCVDPPFVQATPLPDGKVDKKGTLSPEPHNCALILGCGPRGRSPPLLRAT